MMSGFQTGTSGTLDVQRLLDDRPVGRFQLLVLLLCMVIVMLDGLDTVMIGFVAPALSVAWSVPRDALGPIMSGGLLGLAFGALAAGPLADRFGRKKVIVGAVFCFGIWSLASAFATNVPMLTALRFLTGLGLGASLPNAATMMAEYAPAKCRSLMVTTVICGFTLGAACGGFVSAWLVESYGWASVLLLGAALPILFIPIVMIFLPESARFLALREKNRDRLAAILNRIEPGMVDERTRFVTPAIKLGDRNTVRLILSPGYIFGTLMLWLCYFAGLLSVYLLGNWLPTLVRGIGFTLGQAAIVGSLFQIGGTAGSLVTGWLMDRISPHATLAFTVLAGGAFAWYAGAGVHSLGMLGVMAFGMGYCMNGSNTGFCALAASSYPTNMRATGTSWMLGIGRFGAVLGAMLGGYMLHANWGFDQVFGSLMVPAIVGAIAVLLKGVSHRKPLEVSSTIP